MTGLHKTTDILQWNLKGFKAQHAELMKYLESNKPHIIFLQETKIKNTIHIPGYNVIQHGNPNKDEISNIATAVRLDVNYTQTETDVDNVIIIQIEVNKHETQLINIYRSPSKPLNIHELQTYTENKNNTIIIGDLNTHIYYWDTKNKLKRAQELEKFIEKQNLVVINNKKEHTYIHYTGNTTLIDLAITTANIAIHTTHQVIEDTWGSDHYPTLTTIHQTNTQNIQQDTNISEQDKYNITKADWVGFYTESIKQWEHFKVTDDIETTYQNFLQTLYKISDKTIPKKKAKQTRRASVPYWTDKCTKSIKLRKKAANQLRKQPHNTDKIRNYKETKQQVKHTINEAKRDYWENYCNNLTEKSKLTELWQTAKKLKNINTYRTIPTLTENNQNYTTDVEKANVIAKELVKTSQQTNNSKIFRRRKNKYTQKWTNATYNPTKNEYDKEITITELQNAIQNGKKKKSPGLDKIPYEILQHTPTSGLQILLHIYNTAYLQNKYIQDWNKSQIMPIHKTGKPRNKVQSYRPIALTSVISKTLERILTNRLTHYLEENKLLTNVQTGFRKHKSTIDQLIRLKEDAAKAINTKGFTRAILIDYSKAFDTVWIPGLLFKLRKLKINKNIYQYIKNFLTNRQIVVKVQNSLSDTHNTQWGTPQGSVISPILFLIMINDFPIDTTNKVKTSIFADDSAIWITGNNYKFITNKLQQQITKIQKWSNKWGFTINTEKTNTITFTNNIHKVKRHHTHFTIHNKQIKEQTSVKFLGLIFDRKLTWYQHTKYIANKIEPKIHFLKAIANQKFSCNKKTLLILYRSQINSILQYGSELFSTASIPALKKLDSLQYRSLSIIAGTTKKANLIALQNELGELPLNIQRQQQLHKHVIKIISNKTNPANDILTRYPITYTTRQKSTFKQPIIEQLQDITDHINKVQQISTLQKPWEDNIFITDTQLANQICKTDTNTNILTTTVKDHINKYQHKTQIFTDASVKPDGSVGIAINIQDEQQHMGWKIPNNISIYTAEGLALCKAIQHLNSNNNKYKDSIIFTDNLNIVKKLDSTNLQTTDITYNIYLEYLQSRENNINITICWIPSHTGIPGNDIADNIAKHAATNGNILQQYTLPQSEIYSNIKQISIKNWQKQYDSNKQAQFYKQIEPQVNRQIKYIHNNRTIDKQITRLRTNSALLNENKYIMGITTTPTCPNCTQNETTQHILFDCKHTHILPQNLTLKQALTEDDNIQHIIEYLRIYNRQI
jgi:ribonuclease HI